MDRDAHTHSDITRVNPAGPEPGTHRLTVGGLHVCPYGLSTAQSVERDMEKSAEAVVVRRDKTPRGVPLVTADEGPNLLTQGSIGKTRWTSSGSKEQPRRKRLARAFGRRSKS